MAEPSREGTHEIEYATAQVEAVMAKAEAAITILLDSPDGRNRHVAKAVQLILDDNMGPLARRMMQLEEAVDTHHPNPEEREVPDSQPMFANQLVELTMRYDQHMSRRFPRELRCTAQSVFYVLTIAPVMTNQAVHRLNAEVITREPRDPVRTGYLAALLEVAEELPNPQDALERLGEEARNDRMRRFLRQAQDTALDTERIRAIYEPASR